MQSHLHMKMKSKYNKRQLKKLNKKAMKFLIADGTFNCICKIIMIFKKEANASFLSLIPCTQFILQCFILE